MIPRIFYFKIESIRERNWNKKKKRTS